MNSGITGAVLIAMAIIGHAFISGGRYSITPNSSDSYVKLDRWTGETQSCHPQNDVILCILASSVSAQNPPESPD